MKHRLQLTRRQWLRATAATAGGVLLPGTYDAKSDAWDWKVIISVNSYLRHKSGGINFVDGKAYWVSDVDRSSQRLAKQASSTSSMKSASAVVRHIGGLMRRTLPNSPPLPMSSPISRASSTI